MKGKDKCEILSEIREKIAEENGIDFEVIDCDFEGDCQGTCPKCEAEIEYLEKELNKKRKNGEKVKIKNIIESKNKRKEEYDDSDMMDNSPKDIIKGGIRTDFDSGFRSINSSDIDEEYKTLGIIAPELPEGETPKKIKSQNNGIIARLRRIFNSK